MTSTLKKYGAAIILVITAIAVIAVAYLYKGTENENAWLYLTGVGFVLAGAFEVYSRTKNKNKH